MGLLKFRAKDMVVIIIVAAACASVAASITDSNEDISVQSTEESRGHLRDKISSSYSDAGSKPAAVVLKSTNNTTTKHGKKIVHRLVGGHVKLHPKEEKRGEGEDLVASSAGNGKEKSSTRREDEDEKKTLSQQVKEGKYGLIQNEIYPTAPKRPGVISYLGNPEVPRDTSKNYGGLEEEEIWLAENHLLVLRGGKFPNHGKRPENNENSWPPIDDYEAPKRQVKIPARPDVPPPFPVQLTEGGPVQIIRANGSSSIINDTADYEEYANYPEGFYPGEAPFYPTSSNATADPSEIGPAIQKASTSGEPYLPPASGTVGPFYSSLPPGAVFLPPPNNRSDDYDEDDQSIYYPPPYSFHYKPRENATAVPPGPLVPGIILPPPPNFFAAFDEPQNSITTKPKTTTPAAPEETTTYVTPRRKTIAKPLYKQRITTTTPVVPTYAVTSSRPTTRTRPSTAKTLGKTKSRNFSTPHYVLETTTTMPTTTTTTTRTRTTTTTTSLPERTTTLPRNEYYDVQTEIENHLVDLGPPQGGEWTGIVSTTSVPLLAYFETTSTSAEGTRNSEDFAPIHVEAKIPAKNQPAAYYYYEETNGAVKTTPAPQVYYETSTPSSPYYSIEPLTSQRQPKKQYYSVEMIPSQQTANDYESKLSSLAKVRPSYSEFAAHEPAPRNQVKYNVERIRSQSEKNLADNSHRYYQPVTVKPYYTTQRPRFYYRAPEEQHFDYRDERELKSNPVYQYNYESNDYAKPQQGYRNDQEIREGLNQQGYVDYQQPPSPGNQYYDYDSRPVEKAQQKYASRPQRPVYSTVTTRPFQSVINTTPNPEHAYYTKQEEQLLDDVTKQYFTIFGKKLASEVGGVQSTTPLYHPTVVTTTESPIAHISGGNTYLPNSYNSAPQVPRFKPPKVKVHYGDQTQRPYSLEGDTLVNYKNPLPPLNPDAEFIPVGEEPGVNRGHGEFEAEQIPPFRNRPVTENYPPREIYRGRYPVAPISLANDIAVNYHNPRPPINPDAEFIAPVRGQGNANGNRGGSYFAYKLPGNGGHFYFLTPQAISQGRQDIDREYFYSKPIDPRPIRRRRRGPAEG